MYSGNKRQRITNTDIANIEATIDLNLFNSLKYKCVCSCIKLVILVHADILSNLPSHVDVQLLATHRTHKHMQILFNGILLYSCLVSCRHLLTFLHMHLLNF